MSEIEKQLAGKSLETLLAELKHLCFLFNPEYKKALQVEKEILKRFNENAGADNE